MQMVFANTKGTQEPWLPFKMYLLCFLNSFRRRFCHFSFLAPCLMFRVFCPNPLSAVRRVLSVVPGLQPGCHRCGVSTGPAILCPKGPRQVLFLGARGQAVAEPQGLDRVGKADATSTASISCGSTDLRPRRPEEPFTFHSVFLWQVFF